LPEINRENRRLVDLLRSRIAEESPLIQVVLGPRQVGKTTALQTALAGNGVYHTADYPTPLSHDVLLEWWHEAQQSEFKVLAVDEVQKIIDWSETVKYLWDQSKDIKLILTGSSSLLVEKGLKETLAGRFELIRVEHWNFREASEIFNLNLRKFIEFGCYPGSIRFLEDTMRWATFVRDSIVEPAIGRDLLQLYPIDNPALMRQIFGTAVSLPAQLISSNKLQGTFQEKGTAPTISHYFSLLAEAFLVTGVQKYSGSQFRSRKSIPKIIVHDNALCRAFERPVQQALSAERFGRYFENAIGARFIEAGWETYYWKHRDHEVDFVVIGPDQQKWAIEVKSGPVSRDNLSGLIEFCKLYPEFEPQLLSLEGQKLQGIKSLDPVEILSLCRSSRAIQ